MLSPNLLSEFRNDHAEKIHLLLIFTITLTLKNTMWSSWRQKYDESTDPNSVRALYLLKKLFCGTFLIFLVSPRNTLKAIQFR